ncbi:Gfo/Idh/MocA family protein [Alicyclobacillus fastidiosus]|uniref:Gfo/Idh/MocA family oxidoreductase n=1 Tax=Alicyclobacillus fastidiosus TaxID=392011 RepID=A0ABV5AEL7_9BACL|nr:Gfo/Idh/MocA family oxidoreductase [Alicyclobacillus fastidiosus]WEH09797.1 Gfo/Idh/MocA family oxidoreductase [Alicyclobacillus fastidiosus]
MTSKIRVGIVGLGEVAQITHLPILRALSDKFEVTALCDISKTLVVELGKRYNVPGQYTDYSELVSSDNVDLVFVLNSDEYHADTAVAALQHGKHVLIEKPVCLTLADAERLIRARDDAHRQVMVGYMRRYAPAFQMAKRMVAEMPSINYVRVRDIIGQNRLIIEQACDVLRPSDIPDEAMRDRQSRALRMGYDAVGEGYDPRVYQVYRLLCGLSSHDLSAMRDLIGSPRQVADARAWGSNIAAIFEYDGFHAVFETGVDAQRRFDAHIEVYSNHSSVKVQYDTPYIRHLPTTLQISETVGDEYRQRVVRPTFKDPYTCELEELYEVIQTGKTHQTTLEDAVEDLQLFAKIMEKIKNQ